MIMTPMKTWVKAPTPKGHKHVRVHLAFNAKHYGSHKSRLVADENLSNVPIVSAYSGVVSLRGIRLVIFLAELNEIDSWGTDIGNAYLETFAKEKVCIKSEQEFVPLQGHALIISKSLCRLQTSGLL